MINSAGESSFHIPVTAKRESAPCQSTPPDPPLGLEDLGKNMLILRQRIAVGADKGGEGGRAVYFGNRHGSLLRAQFPARRIIFMMRNRAGISFRRTGTTKQGPPNAKIHRPRNPGRNRLSVRGKRTGGAGNKGGIRVPAHRHECREIARYFPDPYHNIYKPL
jgi:hypothetical protein